MGGGGRQTQEERSVHSRAASHGRPDRWAGIPLFTLLKIDSTHGDDVAARDETPHPPPSLVCNPQPGRVLESPPMFLFEIQHQEGGAGENTGGMDGQDGGC